MAEVVEESSSEVVEESSSEVVEESTSEVVEESSSEVVEESTSGDVLALATAESHISFTLPRTASEYVARRVPGWYLIPASLTFC